MTYTREQVGQVLAGVKVSPPDQEIQMTPELLAGWITAAVRNDKEHRAYVVMGLQALRSLASQEWFIRCFDVNKSDKNIGWWGSIFGSPVFIVPDDKCALYRLQADCLYVVSGDGELSCSARLS